jgi:hypothetical protein
MLTVDALIDMIGMLTVRKLENVSTVQNNKPKLALVITQCGQL